MRPGVYVSESALATPVATDPPSTAAGAMLAPLPAGPTGPVLIQSWYDFAQVYGGLDSNYDATFAANMFFRSGGRDLYVSRVVRGDAVKSSVDLLAQGSAETWITFQAKAKGTYGNDLRVSIIKNAADLYDITVLQEAGVAGDSEDDNILESYRDVDLATYQNQAVVDMFAVRSLYIDAVWGTEDGLSVPTSFSVLPLTGGSDGTLSSSYDWDAALNALLPVNRTFVVFAPGVTDETVVSAIVSFAETNKHFAVLDTPADSTPADAVDYADAVGKTSYAAVYYPHLWIADSTARSRDAIKKVAQKYCCSDEHSTQILNILKNKRPEILEDLGIEEGGKSAKKNRGVSKPRVKTRQSKAV